MELNLIDLLVQGFFGAVANGVEAFNDNPEPWFTIGAAMAGIMLLALLTRRGRRRYR